MKKVYFVQSSSVYGGEVCLPYAVGTLAAYAWQNEEIKNAYELSDIIYKKEDFSDCKNKISDPFLVAFSCYIWNFEHNKLFAAQLKKAYPDCIIVFGGHNISNNSSDLLNELPFIDYLLHDEGEVPFCDLLLALNGKFDLTQVSNLSFRRDSKIIKTENICYDVSDFPSPYESGIFDSIINNSDDVFYGILETNRGCPYKCVYCDWGRSTSNIRQFPLDRVKKDIEWLSKHKIGYSVCADANFGILERDVLISKWLVEAKNKTGFPAKIQFCFTKNSDERVFLINKMMHECGLSKGATISLQTLSEKTLSDICRSNMSYEHYTGLVRMYNDAGIFTYTDIILGLPGETYDSFTRGIGMLFEAGQHTSVNVFNCEVLINARLASPELTEKYKIKYAKCVLNKHHSEVSIETEENNTVIIETNTMSAKDWINANIFVAVTGCFHNLSLLQYFAIYLYNEMHIPYEKFYISLIEYFIKKPETLTGLLLAELQHKLREVTENKGTCETLLDGFGNVNWPIEEWLFLQLIEKADTFFAEIIPFLKRFNIEKNIFESLFLYQKNLIKKPGLTELSFDIDYDFPTYFKNIFSGNYIPLQKHSYNVNILDNNAKFEKEIYARETVWYGRKGGRIVYKEELTLIDKDRES